MKQVLQDLKDGRTYLEHVPAPLCQPGCLLIQTRRSVLSPGTERMLVEFGQGNLLQKARSQPERVREVLNKIKTDGLLPTLEAVFAKLGEPLPLGYCNAGVVVECGDERVAARYPTGTRVVSNGHHAEYVLVGTNLTAHIPDNVTDEEAAFTVLGAIALQGIRLAAPTLGETVFVMGLGPVGLLTVQLLRANGCRVIASDFNAERLRLAARFGAEIVDLSGGAEPVAAAQAFTEGRGVDAILITAATKSNDPVRQAAQMARVRGRIVLVGVTGLELDRNEFFKKELTFQVSCSYGPGRYDPSYEQGGHDYPLGHVRWTEQRNFEAVLQLMADGQLDVRPLITHRFPILDAEKAYALLQEDGAALGVVLEYAAGTADAPPQRLVTLGKVQGARSIQAGVIGAGNFTRRVILPLLKSAGAGLHTICSAKGMHASTAARKFGFAHAASDVSSVLDSREINTVFIATPHQSHAALVCQSLRAGKHVFVEKPLAISLEQLSGVVGCIRELNEERGRLPALLVGFNRRFSPHIRRVYTRLRTRQGPACLTYTVNAGRVAGDSWIQDPAVGGGRIVGEVCHFVDTLRFLVDSPVESVQADCVAGAADGRNEDSLSATLRFVDGSIGTIHYFANGPKSYAKERLLAMADGQAMELDNFRATTLFSHTNTERRPSLKQDKGHDAEIRAFLRLVEQGGASPIPFEQLVETTLVTLAIIASIRSGEKQFLADWRGRLDAGPAESEAP